jgi:hypothetical protein
MSKIACPICGTPDDGPARRDIETPYLRCPGCGLFFQHPLPPKILHGEHEVWIGQPMSDGEKAANKALAEWLFEHAMHRIPGPTLDIGASYPILAHYLACLGNAAYAIDPDEEIMKPHGLAVQCAQIDIEAGTILPAWEHGLKFGLVSFIHSLEHTYRPLEVFRRVRSILDDDGALFIRMPDSMVEGIERDLTPGHFTIHPFVHSASTIAELCAQAGAFTIELMREVRPGQRDLILRPIT